MTLGAMTRDADHSAGYDPGSPYRHDVLEFAGDGAYPAGGTPDFEVLVQDALGAKVRVVSVESIDLTGYMLRYDITNDKLVTMHFPTSQGPAVEDTTANQSGRTYQVIVRSR